MIDRREFLKHSAGALAVGAAVAKSSRGAANEAIRVGVVGIRGRGSAHIQGFEGLPGVEVVALCDVDQSVLSSRKDQHDKATGRNVKAYVDLRDLIDDKEIDVVSIATPNHWHSLAGIWAMQNGKDTYVEKPCSHNVYEGRKLVEAARKHKRICQHGTQNRSIESVRDAMRFLHDGGIGKVHTAKGLCYKWRPSIGMSTDESAPGNLEWNLWQGPAQQRSYSKRYVHYNWHWAWNYGNGDIGNQGVHQMDVARWGLGIDGLPTKIQSMGGRYGYEDDGETPNTLVSVMEYPDAVLQFEVRGLPSNNEKGVKVGNLFYGTDGYLVLRGGNWETYMGKKDEPGPAGKSKGGNHFANFIGAVRSRDRKDLHADIEQGHQSSALCHLANIAFRTGRSLTFDPKSETFGKDGDANSYLTREYRSPFRVPEVV